MIQKADANSFTERKGFDKDFFNRVHRARVTDVYVNEGTANVLWERLAYNRKVTWPLMGLSVPSAASGEAVDPRDFMSASWGRYVPQVGDIMIIAFGNDGVPYALGYHDLAYRNIDNIDLENESRGGIGWGDASGRPPLKPGDWDWKSARNSRLYLGALAKLSSGPHSITLDKPNGNITIATTLSMGRYGEASEMRQGGARRKLLSTDLGETDIYSARGGVAQEVNDSVRFGTGLVGGTEIARESLGDVIDETLSTPMAGESGQYVRKLLQLKDLSGVLDAYTEKVDTAGNAVVEADLATVFTWNTPLAAWDVTNLSTSIECTTSFEVSAATISLSSSGTADIDATGNLTLSSDVQATLDAVLVKLGASATEPVVKGTTFLTALQVLLTQMLIDWTALGALGFGANSVAAIPVFLGQLETYKSVKVKTE